MGSIGRYIYIHDDEETDIDLDTDDDENNGSVDDENVKEIDDTTTTRHRFRHIKPTIQYQTAQPSTPL
ncbi:hypothetical protein FQR65_LT16335 [Abscondita terminalis]|nr:hypothetical protein FQR65_LT16335 [Abscondita terminalis]